MSTSVPSAWVAHLCLFQRLLELGGGREIESPQNWGSPATQHNLVFCQVLRVAETEAREEDRTESTAEHSDEKWIPALNGSYLLGKTLESKQRFLHVTTPLIPVQDA